MDFVLINQFYPPARAPTGVLLRDVAMQLCDRGHHVVVITSAAGYGAGEDEPVKEDGIDVRRVGPVRTHRTGLFAKATDYARFFVRAHRVLHTFPRRPDAALCMTTPPFCGRIARRYRRRCDVPYALWCMDLYPEALQASGLLRDRNPLYRMLAHMARAEREQASTVITLGADMSRRIKHSAPSAQVLEVPVWSSLSATSQDHSRASEFREERGWKPDETVLMYSGNMGRAHRAEEIGALAQRKAAAGCRFVFYGTGPLRAQWEARWSSFCAFGEAVERRDVVPHLLSADVHVISQEYDWSGVVVPSKYQAACALGRPVLFVGPADSALTGWIKSGDTGWTIDPMRVENMDALLEEIRQPEVRLRKGRAALEQSRLLFDAEVNAGVVADQVELMAGRKAT